MSHGCDALLDLFQAIFSDQWSVFVDLLVDNIRGKPLKKLVIISGPRNAMKSAVISVLNYALGQARCPASGVDAAMAGKSWAVWSDVDIVKAKIINAFGRSQIRLIDEADDMGRTVHLASIKKEHSPYGLLRLHGASHSIKAPVMPLYIVSSNKLPDTLFTESLLAIDAECVVVFDVTNSVFAAANLTAEQIKMRDAVLEWFITAENNPSDKHKADVSLQLACLVARWMTDPLFSTTALARPDVSLAADRARRAAAQLVERRKCTPENGSALVSKVRSCQRAGSGAPPHAFTFCTSSRRGLPPTRGCSYAYRRDTPCCARRFTRGPRCRAWRAVGAPPRKPRRRLTSSSAPTSA